MQSRGSEERLIEVFGNLWTYEAEARCITTNGFVKVNGAAVMGRGCAKQAMERYPGIEFTLGELLERQGNHVFLLGGNKPGEYLFSFPVKHKWNEPADISLIIRSAYQLRTIAAALDLTCIVLPRPGCGNGQLQWEGFDGVKIQIMNKLDDRFHIIDFGRS